MSTKNKSHEGRSIFKVNHSVTGPWFNAIGQLMLNFGALEFVTNYGIYQLAKDELLHDISVGMPFTKRLKLLEQLIERQESPPLMKQQLKTSCKKMGKLSELRNAVAHNPLVFGWNDPEESGTPDFIGIPNVKKLKRSKARSVPLTNLRELNTAIKETASLAQFLEAKLDELIALSQQKLSNKR